MKTSASPALYRRQLLRSAVLIGSYATMSMWPAAAQTTAAQTGKTPDSSDQLQEIVVVAQKRSENLQRVPIAVTAYSGEALKEKQITNVYDLAQYAPGVQFSTSGTASSSGGTFYIRGIGQFSAHTTNDPAVGIYFDDVYMARSVGSNFDLGDIAQVEVLNGPQGTLFGRNTISGAVSIRTNRPNFDFGGSADMSVGSIDQILAHATVNVPIVDGKLAARFSFIGQDSSGYGTDISANGKIYDLGEIHKAGGRGQLLFNATDDFDILVAGDATRSRGTSMPGGLTAFTPTPTSVAFNQTSPVKVGPQWLVQGYTSHLYIDPVDNTDTRGASVTMTYHPDGITLKSITAYRDLYSQTSQDYGGVPAPWIAQNLTQTQWQVSQEFQATGQLLDDKLKYTFGLYYFSENTENITNAWVFGNLDYIPAKTSTDSKSAYGQVTYNLTDKLSITGGLRYTLESKSINVETLQNGTTALLPLSNSAFDSNAMTPMGNIKYQWTDQVMTYASIARGFRAGEFNAQPFTPTDLIPTAPEKSTTYEIGAKVATPDQRVRVNLAAFYTDYTNIQLGATVLTNGTLTYRQSNAANATIYGTEAQVTAILAPGLEGYLNGSYLQSRIAAIQGYDFGVATLPDAPKFIIDVGLRYNFEWQNHGTLSPSVDANYRTSTYPQFDPAASSRQPAYAVLNARVAYEPNDTDWTFTIWGKNLTDEKYTISGEAATSVTTGWFARPREVGATAAFTF